MTKEELERDLLEQREELEKVEVMLRNNQGVAYELRLRIRDIEGALRETFKRRPADEAGD